jgi:uncharacterized protein with PIN domain
MSEDVEPGSHKPTPVVKSTSVMRRLVVYGGVLLVAFLLGLVPMWLQSRASAAKLAEVERRLTLAGMQNNLAAAAVDARRGDYEPARQAVSQFFTSLRAEIDKGDTLYFTQAQRARVQPLFAGRDEIITLLARSDPASADRLSDLYVAYRKALGG